MPVFLSIGYSTYHWRHVMAHKFFESEDIAAVLNCSFVLVKIDREEHPDASAVDMASCIAVSGLDGSLLCIPFRPVAHATTSAGEKPT